MSVRFQTADNQTLDAANEEQADKQQQVPETTETEQMEITKLERDPSEEQEVGFVCMRVSGCVIYDRYTSSVTNVKYFY